jgi:hypothetical protein
MCQRIDGMADSIHQRGAMVAAGSTARDCFHLNQRVESSTCAVALTS